MSSQSVLLSVKYALSLLFRQLVGIKASSTQYFSNFWIISVYKCACKHTKSGCYVSSSDRGFFLCPSCNLSIQRWKDITAFTIWQEVHMLNPVYSLFLTVFKCMKSILMSFRRHFVFWRSGHLIWEPTQKINQRLICVPRSVPTCRTQDQTFENKYFCLI